MQITVFVFNKMKKLTCNLVLKLRGESAKVVDQWICADSAFQFGKL